MKILQVISGLGNGGAEKFVVELSNALSKNHTVMLCSFKAVDGHFHFPELLNTSVTLTTFGKTKGFDASVYSSLSRLIRKEKPDVVHFHLDATLKYVMPLMAFFFRIKFIYTIHSDLNVNKKKIFSQLSRISFVSKRVTWVCIAPAIRMEFEKAFPSLKFQMVENGIAELKCTSLAEEVKMEVAGMKLTGTTTVLISVAKLNGNKNQALLMEAMKQLNDRNVILLLVGHDSSSDQHYLKKLTAMSSGNVFFLGLKSNVADYLTCSDAFVITSLNEGLPISALEAFSFGLPVITTPAGGLKDLVEHGKNGFVTKDFSKEALLSSLKEYLDLKDGQKEKIGQENRRKFLAHYTMKACAGNYESLYTKN
jgi:glycosyltransferase involved in cell wall biosynthesis